MSEPTKHCEAPIPVGCCGSQYQWKPCGNPTPCQRHTIPAAPEPLPSEPTKEQIDRMWLAVATSNEPQRALAQAIADATAPLHEKIASLEKQLEQKATGTCGLCLAAIYDVPAPPAQTQQGLSEGEAERKLLDEAAACIESEVAAADDDKHPTIRAHAHVATRIRKWLARPSSLEKQPSPAAAPAQLSALATAQRGLDEWCKAAMQERARADAAEARLAALAGQPAPTGLINQCDGCRAGRPIDKNGNHRMGDGDYPNLQACQRHLYSQPAPTDDQKALRAAALEEAAQHYADPQLEDTNTKCRHVAQFLRRLAAGALAGSPAQQGQLGKEGAK